MVTIAAAVLLALVVLDRPWGLALVVTAIAWEVLEKAFWFSRTKGIPIAIGPEAMIGRPVDVITACKPDGTVTLSGERWNARCRGGADVGETVIVEAVERLTLIVTRSRSATA